MYGPTKVAGESEADPVTISSFVTPPRLGVDSTILSSTRADWGVTKMPTYAGSENPRLIRAHAHAHPHWLPSAELIECLVVNASLIGIIARSLMGIIAEG
jgi:hypothetical protein